VTSSYAARTRAYRALRRILNRRLCRFRRLYIHRVCVAWAAWASVEVRHEKVGKSALRIIISPSAEKDLKRKREAEDEEAAKAALIPCVSDHVMCKLVSRVSVHSYLSNMTIVSLGA
jgi:hypothetical protein